jgi:hypothetical protein
VQDTLDGAVLLPEYVAMKPIVVLAPGASWPLYAAFVTVTLPPDWLASPFQSSSIAWLPGKVQPSCQLFSVADPVFVTTTCPWKPSDQLLTTEYVPEQPLVTGAVVLGDGDGDAEGEGGGDDEPPLLFTEKELVSRPAPPCHSSNPASTSIRYQLLLV